MAGLKGFPFCVKRKRKSYVWNLKRISLKPFWKGGLTADFGPLVLCDDAPLPEKLPPYTQNREGSQKGSIPQSLMRPGAFIFKWSHFPIGCLKKTRIPLKGPKHCQTWLVLNVAITGNHERAELFFLPHGGIEQPCDFQNLPKLDKSLMFSQAWTKKVCLMLTNG